jgi:raffinose/stachyose/melibiose transport system substrate-binding protein
MSKLRYLSLAVMFVLALFAGACAGPVAPAAPAAGDAAAATDAEAAAADAAAATGPAGTLTFLSWYNQDLYQPLLDAFQAEYPEVEIEFQNVPAANNQYVQRLQLLASSGELPDLFYVGPPVTLMAKNGYLADLSDLPAVQALPEGYKTYYTYDGKVYGYAPDAWVGGVFYNKQIFADNGIAEPKTWGDFIAAAEVLQKAGIRPITMSADSVNDLVYWLHNTEVLTQDPNFDAKINTGEVTFADGYGEAFNTWKTQLVDTGFIGQDVVALTDDQRFNEFATGEAAMTISGPWAINGILEKNPDLDLGIFPFRGSTEDRTYTVGAVNVGLAIAAEAKNPQAAQAFIDFLGTPEGLSIYQKITGNFLGVEGVEFEINPVMEAIRPYAEAGQFGFPPVVWTHGSTLAPMITKGMHEIILGSKTTEQLVEELDARQAELSATE